MSSAPRPGPEPSLFRAALSFSTEVCPRDHTAREHSRAAPAALAGDLMPDARPWAPACSGADTGSCSGTLTPIRDQVVRSRSSDLAEEPAPPTPAGVGPGVKPCSRSPWPPGLAGPAAVSTYTAVRWPTGRVTAGVPAFSSLVSRSTSGSTTSLAREAGEDRALLTPMPPSETAPASAPPAPAGARLWFQCGSKPTPVLTASTDTNQARAAAGPSTRGDAPPHRARHRNHPREGPAWEAHFHSGRELERAQEFQKFFYLQIM